MFGVVGCKPIERPPGSTPPAASPTPSVPNVWRKGEATPRPDNPPIGGLVGKTPKKKLDEPVDLAKEFEKRSNAAPKKAQPKEPEEFSANKKDRMGRTEPTTTQNKEPELRADTRPDRIFEPSNDSSAPTWGGRVIGGVGTAGAGGGAAYLWNKYKDEQNKAEKEKAYKEIYGPDAEMPVPREKPSVREPADPDNPDYENLKEVNGLSKIPASKDLASHSGFAIDVDRGDLAKFHKWLQAEKKAGNDYGLETGLEWGGKARDPVHIQARSWQTIEKQRQFDKNQEQGTQVAQNKPVDKSRRQNQSADVEKKNKEKELKDRLARELAASKQFDQPSGGSAKSTPVKPEATPARPEVTPTQIAGNNKPDDTKTKAHPAGTYVQPDWSKYSYGDLGPLKKDKNGVWKTEDGKQTATDPKLIADLEKLSPAKEPSIIDKAVASLPSFLGGKDASAKSKPTPDPTTTKKDVEQPKDASSASDVERGKALDKIIRGVAGDLSGATAADKRDEYYRQQLEKAKQEKAERDKIEASKAEKKPEEPAKKVKAKKAKSTKKADQPRGGSALASAEREPDTVTIVPASPPPPPPVADKIDVKDLTTDQAGLAAVKTDTKVDQNAELVARKQAEENQRRQEAERKAAEARAQAEADRLAAQARAQQELEANRQAEIERAKKAAPIQQTAQQDSGSGFKNMWDKGIEAFTGKQRVNLRDPRITLPESINTELEEILRLAGKKTKE
jgi:hypothetical protein